MLPAGCSCVILKKRNELLKCANELLIAENRRLKVEVGTFRLLISQMKDLRERETPESSETESEGEDGDDDCSREIQVDTNPLVPQTSQKVSNLSAETVSFDSAVSDSNDAMQEDPPLMSGHASLRQNIHSNPHADQDEEETQPVDTRTVDTPQKANINRTVAESENETDDEYSLESSDDRDQDDVRDESILRAYGFWKCAHCQKKIRGDRRDRLKHIAVHKNFKLRCPINGCDALLVHQRINAHILDCHRIKFDKLKKAQIAHLRMEREEQLKKSEKFESEFFPTENAGDAFKKSLNFCKKCDLELTTVRGKIKHIGAHLQVKIRCPVRECDRLSSLNHVYVHLARFHKLNSSQLSREMQEELKDSRKMYMKAVDDVKHEYFDCFAKI